MKGVLLFVARALFSLPFIIDGIGKLLNWSAALTDWNEALYRWQIYIEGFGGVAFVGDVLQYGVSKIPFVMGVAIVLEVVGGGLVLVAGYTMRIGTSLLLLFSLLTTLIFHPFWLEVGEDFHIQVMLFLRNISIVGLSLYLLIVSQKEKIAT